MKNLKELIILHSNDMHGDFLAEQIDEKLVGGVSLLSGYVNMVRNQEKNVLYAIAGDMFRGSVIDSEYKGVSTIGIMNLLGPDVALVTTRLIMVWRICCFWRNVQTSRLSMPTSISALIISDCFSLTILLK